MLFKQFFMIERLFFIGVRAGAGVKRSWSRSKMELEPVKNGAGAGQKRTGSATLVLRVPVWLFIFYDKNRVAGAGAGVFGVDLAELFVWQA